MAFELVLVLTVPILFALVLFRLKSVLNGALSLAAMFVVLFYLSSFAAGRYRPELKAAAVVGSPPLTANLSVLVERTFADDHCGGNRSTLRDFQAATNVLELNLYGLNALTLVAFLVTLYLKSALSIYYCTLTSLERWNLAFLSTLHHTLWRQLAIWTGFVLCTAFGLVCGAGLLLGSLGSAWRLFALFPLYALLALFWTAFQLLNTVNLLHLLNKIADCFLLLNESAISGTGENSSNLSRKSKSNRQSTLSEQSNHNLSSGSVSSKTTTRCGLRKILSRFLSYHKLSVNDDSVAGAHAHALFNIPIHRILNYKGSYFKFKCSLTHSF